MSEMKSSQTMRGLFFISSWPLWVLKAKALVEQAEKTRQA